MGRETVRAEQVAEREAGPARPPALSPLEQLASAVGNQAFGRMLGTAPAPVLARTMRQKVSFVPHLQGGQVNPATLRAIKTELDGAWADLQADEIQFSYMDDDTRETVRGLLGEYDAAMNALLTEIRTGNPPDPELVGLPTNQVEAGATELAKKLKVVMRKLAGIRNALNKAFEDHATDQAPVPAVDVDEDAPVEGEAPAVPQPEAAPEFEYVYDTHGDKHFMGQDSQWNGAKPATLTKMLDALEEVEDQIVPVCNAYYLRFPRQKAQNRPACLYLTLEDDKPVGELKNKGGPTPVWTVQVDVDLERHRISYHGYPDDLDATIGFKITKKGK